MEMPKIRSVLRGNLRPDPQKVHRLTQRRVWEAAWRPLAGVEDCVQRGERERERGQRGRCVPPRPPRQTLAISHDHWN